MSKPLSAFVATKISSFDLQRLEFVEALDRKPRARIIREALLASIRDRLHAFADGIEPETTTTDPEIEVSADA